MSQKELFDTAQNPQDKQIDSPKAPQPVVCLGKTFASEEERREFFRNELRTKLPELKKIEGFPIGEDEDIINLSDPPYYTACPNPWLNDFIDEWEKEKEHIPGRRKDFHVDEPYASDVSEGKNNPIYNAHGYHTKVPHPAIMRYILHYTQPGDIVLDGFAGTGMTGVAAELCGNPDIATKYKIEEEWKKINNDESSPIWGFRRSIIGDLSPIASFIAYNYNMPIDLITFDDTANTILKSVDKECKWMYETQHANGSSGQINYTIWSDVFTCPNCNEDIIFWETGLDKENGKVLDEFKCPNCKQINTKRTLDKKWITIYDEIIGKSIRQTKIVPVLINYKVGSKTFEKKPDKFDLQLIEKIEKAKNNYWYPTNELPYGFNTEQPKRSHGNSHIHHFHTSRNRFVLASIWAKSINLPALKWTISSIIQRSNKQHQVAISRVGGEKSKEGGKTAGHRRGTLYIPSIQVEFSVLELIKERYKIIIKALRKGDINFAVTTQAVSQLLIDQNSVDYIFTDPPFGANIMYSELNLLWETWLKVTTNNLSEAIENKTQNKSIFEYQELMTQAFKEYHRILKPNKWMTVEFSNTSSAVWNSIQNALQKAGFIIANVAALDKKQRTHSARTSSISVNQDLVISCYKLASELEVKINDDVFVWDFVIEHLHHLPTHIRKDNSTTAIVERSPKVIYDRLITFYLMRSLPVPIDAKDFQEGLKQRFIERDGMYFTAEQAAEYDEKKAKAPQFVQLSLIVTNESDAIEWLKDRLRKQSQKYQDIMPDFRIATQSLRKGDTLPELQDILNESFIQEPDGRWRTPDPNEAKDREALRTKVLLKEFNAYATAINQPKAKKLKEVRVESLRAGFKNCWEQKDFKTIVTLGDMIPQNILLEDEQLLMYYDIAKDRI